MDWYTCLEDYGYLNIFYQCVCVCWGRRGVKWVWLTSREDSVMVTSAQKLLMVNEIVLP